MKSNFTQRSFVSALARGSIEVYDPHELRRRRSKILRNKNNRRYKVLSPREARIVGAVGETLFPADGGSMPTVQDAKVIDYMDDLLLNLQFQERILIRALLTLVEVQSLAFNGWKPKLFSRATMDERTRNLKGWETSRLFHRRVVFMSIRTLLLWAYVDSREAERGIGLDPESRQEARQAAARRAILRASQAQAEASSADSFSGRLNAQ